MTMRDLEDVKQAVVSQGQQIQALDGRVASMERRQEIYEQGASQQNRDARNNLIASILTLVVVLTTLFVALMK